jgi:NADH-quinone oxidoreductase subunit N
LIELAISPRSGFYGYGLYLWDGQTLFFQEFILAATALTLILALLSASSPPRWSFLLFAAVGMMLLAAVNDFLLLLVAWALAFLPSVLAVAGGGRSTSTDVEVEAGFKYLFLGMVASVLLALGIALVFSMTGSTRFDVVAGVIETGQPTPALLAGILLVLAGLGFTVAAAPFHFWAPDAQQGASTPVSAFLAVAVKGAGCAALLRVLDLPFSGVPVEGIVLAALVLMGVLSLAFGSLAGLPQRNLKRSLGYLGIATTGFLLAALAANSRAGHQALFFSLAAYLLGVFPILAAVGLSAPESRTLPAFAGLARRSPLLAWAVALAVASLAGIPPLPGFFARFLTVAAAWQGGQYGLAAAVVFFSLPVLYVALALIRAMFAEEPVGEAGPLSLRKEVRIFLGAGITLTLFCGLWPGPLMAWIARLL